MNASEQKKHTTALDDLAAAMEEFVEATEERIVRFEKEMRDDLSAERLRAAAQKHEIDLCLADLDADIHTLRDYVDARLVGVREDMRTFATDLLLFKHRSFRERLRWVIFGE